MVKTEHRQALLSRLALVATALAIIVLDQLSKAWVLETLRPYESIVLAPWLAPFFNITYVTNSGAAFGVFQSGGMVFTIIAIVVVGVILVYIHGLPAHQRAAHVILGVLLGGATGNLIDRFRHGHVIDFLDLNVWPLETFPVFNVADTSIVLGVVLLALLSFRDERQRAKEDPVTAEPVPVAPVLGDPSADEPA